jgi:DNA-binding FadR family transcriptional regulator
LLVRFNASRGTIREALKSLEVQGLVRLKTGPGGGAIVTTVPIERAENLLGNYFYGTELTLANVYEVRRTVEPVMAATLADRLSDHDFRRLEASIHRCACSPGTAEESRGVRMAELEFHDILAEACPNPLLGFYCRFINRLLKNLMVCQEIYERDNSELTAHGHEYHVALLQAYRDGDPGRVHGLMDEHIAEAERIMMASEAFIERRFLSYEGDAPEASEAMGTGDAEGDDPGGDAPRPA